VAVHDLAGLPEAAAADLGRQIHQLVQGGFSRQPYHLPLAADCFRRWLEQRQVMADPQLTLLALAEGRLVGLLLGHRSGDDLVVRTLVVQPGRAQAGLGRLLLQEGQEQAQRLGCGGVIHALMHEAGPSLALSRRWPGSPQGYVLLGRRLGRRE
jgi:GNAT superfamily N-acetyltransferase